MEREGERDVDTDKEKETSFQRHHELNIYRYQSSLGQWDVTINLNKSPLNSSFHLHNFTELTNPLVTFIMTFSIILS